MTTSYLEQIIYLTLYLLPLDLQTQYNIIPQNTVKVKNTGRKTTVIILAMLTDGLGVDEEL